MDFLKENSYVVSGPIKRRELSSDGSRNIPGKYNESEMKIGTIQSEPNKKVERLEKKLASNQEELDSLKQKHTTLQDDHEALQKTHASLHKSHHALQRSNSTLQAQCQELADALNTIQIHKSKSEQKLAMSQTRTSETLNELQAKNKILEDRCKALSASAEQHRLAGLRHNEKLNSMYHDMQSLASIDSNELTTKTKKLMTISEENEQLGSSLERIDSAYTQLCSEHSDLKQQHEKITNKHSALKSKLADLKEQNSEMSNKNQELSDKISELDQADKTYSQNELKWSSKNSELGKQYLDLAKQYTDGKVELKNKMHIIMNARNALKSAPVDPELTKKTVNILKSSTQLIALARCSPGKLEACLDGVSSALGELGQEIDGRYTIEEEWMERKDKVLHS